MFLCHEMLFILGTYALQILALAWVDFFMAAKQDNVVKSKHVRG